MLAAWLTACYCSYWIIIKLILKKILTRDQIVNPVIQRSLHANVCLMFSQHTFRIM